MKKLEEVVKQAKLRADEIFNVKYYTGNINNLILEYKKILNYIGEDKNVDDVNWYIITFCLEKHLNIIKNIELSNITNIQENYEFVWEDKISYITEYNNTILCDVDEVIIGNIFHSIVYENSEYVKLPFIDLYKLAYDECMQNSTGSCIKEWLNHFNANLFSTNLISAENKEYLNKKYKYLTNNIFLQFEGSCVYLSGNKFVFTDFNSIKPNFDKFIKYNAKKLKYEITKRNYFLYNQEQYLFFNELIKSDNFDIVNFE